MQSTPQILAPVKKSETPDAKMTTSFAMPSSPKLPARSAVMCQLTTAMVMIAMTATRNPASRVNNPSTKSPPMRRWQTYTAMTACAAAPGNTSGVDARSDAIVDESAGFSISVAPLIKKYAPSPMRCKNVPMSA